MALIILTLLRTTEGKWIKQKLLAENYDLLKKSMFLMCKIEKKYIHTYFENI